MNQYGIVVEEGSDSNVFWNNDLINNSAVGALILNKSTESQSNLLYYNIFNNSLGINALSNCLYNYWDNGTHGNYWCDYVGTDKNDDGIGDDPYYIDGAGNNQDSKPIFQDGLDLVDPDIDEPDTDDSDQDDPNIPVYSGFDLIIIGIIVVGIIALFGILGTIGYVYKNHPDKLKGAFKKLKLKNSNR